MAQIKPVTYEEELKKNPDLKEEEIQSLKEWYKKQPHLPKMTDAELVLFFHSNYYRMEPTKLTIDTYYTVKTHVPEFFSNRDPLGQKELRKAFQTVWVPTNPSYFLSFQCNPWIGSNRNIPEMIFHTFEIIPISFRDRSGDTFLYSAKYNRTWMVIC